MAMKKKAPSRGGASDKSKKADSARQSLVARSYATEYYLDPTLAQSAKGSDTGLRNKAAVAQKKSQAATSSRTNKGASYLKNSATSKKNDLAGASGRGGAGLGRTSGRAYYQVANSFRPLVKEGKAQKANAAKVAKNKN